MLRIAGVSVWCHLPVPGLRQRRAAFDGGVALVTLLTDRGFRDAHRDALHFADPCFFFGAAAVAASIRFGP